jgi:hypothetical protein
MQLIFTQDDRKRLGFRTGLYELCIFGLQDSSSVGLTPIEENTGGRYTASDGVVYTVNVPRGKAAYFRYTQTFLAQRANITVRIEGLKIDVTKNQQPPKIFYRVCGYSNPADCYLNGQEQNGSSKNMIELAAGNISNSAVRTGQISHDPKVCSNPSSCYYLISVYYADNAQSIMLTSFQVTTFLAASQAVSLDDSFRNVMLMGQYFYYQLLPGNSESFEYLSTLTVKLESIVGDADLVVSTSLKLPRLNDPSNMVFTSRQTDRFEAITLVRSDNFTLNRPIYIGVYASSMTAYVLKFERTYTLQYQIKLEKATPLQENTPIALQYNEEYEESFFSYFPWWSASENRTMILFADVIFNKIFFYAKLNDFPQFYTTDWLDQNDAIAFKPTDYSISDGVFIRVRPDFALYDLISKREYIFKFIAFSQINTGPEAGKFIDLHCGDMQIGYANGSSNFYRHYLIDKNSTVNITVDALQGNPILLVKFSSTPAFPVSSDPSSYELRQDNQDDPKASEFIRVDPEWRYITDTFCDRAGYPVNGGNTFCTLYIAVECQGQCVYRIQMQMEGRKYLNSTFTNKNIPIYLTDEGYYTGSVGENEIKYFYYPVSKQMADTVIYLNKTGPLGKNGDSRLLLSVQGDAGNAKFVN